MSTLLQNAVLRGEQIRCPACTRFKPLRGACSQCGCGEVPFERYAAARVLLKAGVDRFSLAQRAAALDSSQAATMERQQDEQWLLAQPLIEDVRRCEEQLLLRGHAEEFEDSLASMIPTDPAFLASEIGPLEKRPQSLEALFSAGSSWTVRSLAALALLHQGKVSRDVLYSVHSSLLSEGRVGVEAALALGRWRVWRWVRLNREGWQQVQKIARVAMGHSELAPRAAVAWMRASGEKSPDEPDVLFALRRGLEHPDPDVRFECALCLRDEAGLAAALDSPVAEMAAEARRALAPLGSRRLLERLVQEGSTDFARDVVNSLAWPPPPGTLEALLGASERGPDRLSAAILDLTGRQPFAEWSQEDRARWAAWARSVLCTLPGEEALRFLHWAGQPPVDRSEMRPFVEAVAEALAQEPPEARARSLREGYLSRFLALAGLPEESLLKQWAREPECGPPLAEALMTLTSRIRDWEEPPGQAARMLMAVWQVPHREQLLEPLAKAVGGWSGIVGREELIEAVWERFQAHPDERADLLTVFAPWRQELWERQLASPEDAVTRFQAWWPIDPEGPARQADLLMREVPVDELPRRFRCVRAAAEDLVATRPLMASLLLFYGTAPLANAFRAGEESLTAEVERFLEWYPGFEQRLQAAPPEEDRRAPQRLFLEELQTELRLMRERLEAMREEAERELQREMKRKEAEARRLELERQAEQSRRAAEESRRAAEEAQREADVVRAVMEAAQAARTESLPYSLQPRIDAKAVDSEIIFPGKPLATLVDYVRLLKTMSQGGDPLKAMTAVGLDVGAWAAAATEWGQVMTRRLDLGMRFGELFSAPWE